MAEYKKHLLVYLDILGFRDLIQESQDDPSKVDAIAEILEVTQVRANFGLDLIRLHLPESVPQMQTFSDLIIRATPINDPNDLLTPLNFELISMVAIQSEITCKHGILLRGGISMRDLHMKNGKVFGPALVRAYHLAEELAVYPRIVIDSELIPYLKTQDSILRNFRKQGDDGVHFVDYLYGVNYRLGESDKRPTSENKFASLSKHRAVVAGKLKELASKSERVRQKIIWMALYHNTVLDRLMEKDSSDHERYLQLRFSDNEIQI